MITGMMTGQQIAELVSATLIKPALELLAMIDATKGALKECFGMPSEQADEFIELALTTIHEASVQKGELEKKCKAEGKDVMEELEKMLKEKGLDPRAIEKEYEEFEKLFNL